MDVVVDIEVFYFEEKVIVKRIYIKVSWIFIYFGLYVIVGILFVVMNGMNWFCVKGYLELVDCCNKMFIYGIELFW